VIAREGDDGPELVFVDAPDQDVEERGSHAGAFQVLSIEPQRIQVQIQ
jgi:hypothetical protein